MLFEGTFRYLIRFGRLEVILPDGKQFAVEGRKGPRFRIRFTRRADLMRLPFRPTLAIGEAYMGGRLLIEEGGSLYDLVEFLAANRIEGGDPWLARLAHAATFPFRRFQQYNTAGRARAFISHHYNLPDELYEIFLDKDRQYSCAYFPTPEVSLDEAQEAKKRRIAAKLHLSPGRSVLDVGSGWGGLGLYLATEHEANVTGLTLSESQLKVARRRLQEAGLAKQVRFELRDYRSVKGTWDRIVSVGMFEHVGVAYYQKFFEMIARCLVNEGVALLHTIGRSDGPGITDPFIRKYIFPGGYIPALSEIIPAIEKAGLVVTDVEVLRLHYAETLRHWRERFLAAREQALRIRDERFLRMWEFYLAGSEATFRAGVMSVFQIQVAKRVDSLPITRNYMSD